MRISGKWVLFASLTALVAQPRPAEKHPFQSQSASTVRYGQEADHADFVEISNVAYELVPANIPGRPRDEWLILRKTTKTRQVVGDIGMEASTTVEAWPMGVDHKQKPLYSIVVPGFDPVAKNSDVLVISRGTEEVAWWSVYKVGSGQLLFDTYVPMVSSLVRGSYRYAGYEAPPDDTTDTRLKAPNVVGVLSYASGDKLLREALITCDNPKRAELLRSYADSERELSFKGRTLRVTISQTEPAPASVTIAVPIAGDDLDLAHVQMPAGLRITAWKR